MRIEEPLYFANIAQIKRLFARIEKLGDPMAHPGQQKTTESDINAIIIHARNIITIDARCESYQFQYCVENTHRLLYKTVLYKLLQKWLKIMRSATFVYVS